MLKITKKIQCNACVRFFQGNMLNAYIQFLILYTYIRDNFFDNYLEAKRIQVFPLNLQYQKVLSDFFKKKSVEAYEFRLMWNSIVQSTWWGWKILKNFIKHKVIAIEINLFLWSFIDFSQKFSGKLDVRRKNGFDIRVQQEKSYQDS